MPKAQKLLSPTHPDMKMSSGAVFSRRNYIHNAPQVTENTRCPYCGRSNDPDWLTCGEGQTWGCGAGLV